MAVRKSGLIFKVTIGETVRAWREAQKMTLTDLAGATKYNKSYISQLENNKIHNPSDDHLIRIAGALNIPVLFLVIRRLPGEVCTDQ